MTPAEVDVVAERVWELFRAAAPTVQALEVTRPGRKVAEVRVGRSGAGVLSWLAPTDAARLACIAVGGLVGDRVLLELHRRGKAEVEQVWLRGLLLSTWSGAWVPLTEARVWPENVVLGRSEEAGVLLSEADLFGVPVSRQGELQLLVFRVGDHPRLRLEKLANDLQDEAFREAYLGRAYGTLSDQPIPERTRSITSPLNRFTLEPYQANPLRPLPNAERRLFKQHWVYDIVFPNGGG